MKAVPTSRFIIMAMAIFAVVSASGFAATITGTIVFEGDPPTMKEINMDSDPICHSKHKEPIRNEALVLGDDQKMANVFVRIVSGLPDKEYPVPEKPVVLSQAGCMFTPHVFGIRAGQPLEILNPDGTLHNVHTLSKKNVSFNIAMPKFKKKTTKVFKELEDMFPIKCDVHPWMSTYCVVMDHPYFDITEKDGVFTIKGLEGGTYEIEARHERLGPQTVSVTVAAEETKSVDFAFSRPKR